MEDNNQFDGTLVALVTGDIEDDFFQPKKGKLRIYDKRTRDFVPIGFNLAAVLAMVDDAKEDGRELSFPAAIEETHSVIPVDNVRAAKRWSAIIEEGRLQMAALLNTGGGLVSVRKNIIDVMRLVRKNKGRVSAFGKCHVESAGADIFMAADRRGRFLERGTTMMFHLISHLYQKHGKQNGLVTKGGERSWRALSVSLMKRTRPQYRSDMERLLSKAEEGTASQPDRPIYISSRRAGLFGFAEICRSLREKFEEVLGIDEFPKRSAVGRFFDS